MDDTTAILSPGVLLAGRYRLVRAIGRGAVGRIWLAEDERLGAAPVACKLLDETLGSDRQAVNDLKREVLITRRLRHPNIVGVYTLVEAESQPFITMEFVEGQDLAAQLTNRGAPMSLEEALQWLGPVAGALDYAHAEHILHRDIKPTNILIRTDGHALLADFGIAQTVKQARQQSPMPYVSGTVSCMSPEQLQGGPLDHRSDLYSLASTVYETLAGHPPFYDGDVMAQVQLRPPDPIPGLGDDANAVLLSALAKRPEARPYSCGIFFELLATASESGVSIPRLASARQRITDPDSDTVRIKTTPRQSVPRRLGAMLVEAGLISGAALSAALARQEATGERLGEVLCAHGAATEDGIAQTLAAQLRLPRADAQHDAVDPALTLKLGMRFLIEHGCLPLVSDGPGVALAMADPLDLQGITAAEEILGTPIDPFVATPSAIAARLQTLDESLVQLD